MIRLSSDLIRLLQDRGSVLVPSRQRARAVRLGFAAEQLRNGVRVWPTPDVLTAEAWLIRELEELASAGRSRLPRLLSPAEDWLLWRQCTAAATRELELMNRSALAESLRGAHSLATEYRIELADCSLLGSEAELFGRIQQAVGERCRALDAASVQMLVSELSGRNLSTGVTAAGFLRLPPRLQALGIAHRAAASPLATPRVLVPGDESDELGCIAHWCRQQIAKQPDARLLVILPGSAGARERLATLIRQAVDPAGWLGGSLTDPETGLSRTGDLVALEGGAPLADVPVIAHALSTLRWLGGSTGEFEDVSEWLRAPYWNEPGAGARARLDLWLRESGHLNVNGRQWHALLSSAPAPIAPGARLLIQRLDAGIQALGERPGSPREWSERFRAALNAVRWPGPRTRDSSEQQTVLRFHELLDEFGQLASSTRTMSRDEAIHWFGELAARTAYRPADDDTVVTLSAALTDPVVLYDGIWVAGLHADAFPQPVQPDPFIPLAAQIKAGIPAASAGGRLAEAHALVAAWRAATPELVLSAPAHAEDLELLPSPLLSEWTTKRAPGRSRARSSPGQIEFAFASEGLPPAAPEAARGPAPEAARATASAAVPHASPWLAQLIHRPDRLEYFEDSSGLPWPAAQVLPSGTRSLELQNLCAFRAYAELRLGSSELGTPEPGVAPTVRGQLLHAALQILWNELRDSHALSNHSDSSLEAIIERSVAKAADTILGQVNDGERAPVFIRECRRTSRLIRKLCALERSRNPFTVADTEFERTVSAAGAQMQVRIDRLDALEAGGLAILDYKSGRRTQADWYGERPSHPQLLAYLAAVGGDVVAMATVNVTAREVRFDGIAQSSQLLPRVKGVEGLPSEPGDAWQIRTRDWLACVERLASSFLAGRAVLDPKPGACEYCHAVGVCRIADRGIDVAAEVRTIQFDGIEQ